jgi:hypothetical protein
MSRVAAGCRVPYLAFGLLLLYLVSQPALRNQYEDYASRRSRYTGMNHGTAKF